MQAADPVYQAVRREKEKQLAVIAEQRRSEQELLLKELTDAGAPVDWVGRLCGMPLPDERIYPILLEHLTRTYSPWLLEWMSGVSTNETD